VVAAVTPFNFPLNLVLHKVGPALAAGCPVVLKPAEKAPLTAERLAALLRSVGLPDGWLEIVHGYGAEVVPPLVTHPDVSLVSFTGSGRVAAALQRLAPEKPVLTELGGSAPMLVEADADLDRAARAAVAGGFGFAGQTCISVQRVYAARPVYEALCERIVAGARALVVGDPSDAATDLGPLFRPSEADRVRAWVDEAVARGGRLLTGGEWREGAVGPGAHPGLVRPVVLTDVPPDAAVVCEEVFGPVVVVDAYDTIGEGIARANATRYGLNAAVFTRDIGAALAAARGLRAGAVLVNESPTFRADHMPYGGVGASGNTREGPAWAARAFTREKLVVLEGG
jgi:acyl-CoA reductase-like NAD-dependent aldehyde dehydrogenase